VTDRAHFYKPIQNLAGDVQPNAVVRVLQPGTTTPITEQIFVGPSGSTEYSQPISFANGIVDFYLDAPKRVRLGVTLPTQAEVFFEDVDVAVSQDTLTIQDDGDPLPVRSVLDVYGTGYILDDDSGNGATRLRIPGITGADSPPSSGTAEFPDQDNSFYQRGDGYFHVAPAAAEGDLYIVSGQPNAPGGDGLRFVKVGAGAGGGAAVNVGRLTAAYASFDATATAGNWYLNNADINPTSVTFTSFGSDDLALAWNNTTNRISATGDYFFKYDLILRFRIDTSDPVGAMVAGLTFGPSPSTTGPTADTRAHNYQEHTFVDKGNSLFDFNIMFSGTYEGSSGPLTISLFAPVAGVEATVVSGVAARLSGIITQFALPL
jgi:hypothetical protein